jgi:alpha-beta hydrolase superfamily lysophospholipase
LTDSLTCTGLYFMEKKSVKKKLLSVIRWILWVLLVQFVLVNISAGLYAHKITHLLVDPSIKDEKPARNIFSKTWKIFIGPRQLRTFIAERPTFPYDTISLTTTKGITIDAWYSKSDSASKGTVLLFHGIAANKGMLLAEASEFRYLGYNILMVDFRAHGNSSGTVTTLGIRETEEVKLAYDYISKLGEKNIFLYGSSMGSVVVMKAIGDYQLKPSSVLLEMPFASLQSHLKARARTLGFPSQPFAFLVTFWIGVEKGFNGFNHVTSQYAKKVDCPVLMQWGLLDDYVQKKETDVVFSTIASANKKLVSYEHAGHQSLLQSDPSKWRMEVERFLNTNTK